MKSPALGFLLAAAVAAGAFAQATPPPAASPVAPAPPVPLWKIEWAYLSRYHDANLLLGPPAPGERRVVFFGDSITEAWGDLAKYFPGKPYVNRGIGGQTTNQMLARFQQDVVGLKPAAVMILAGTNDIAGNNGPMPLDATEANLQSLVELAQVNGIHVVLASVLPAYAYPWRPGNQPAGKIAELNHWIAEYCSIHHLAHVDYYSPMADSRGGLPPALASDGVHPTPAGYALMAPLAERGSEEALNFRQPAATSQP